MKYRLALSQKLMKSYPSSTIQIVLQLFTGTFCKSTTYESHTMAKSLSLLQKSGSYGWRWLNTSATLKKHAHTTCTHTHHTIPHTVYTCDCTHTLVQGHITQQIQPSLTTFVGSFYTWTDHVYNMYIHCNLSKTMEKQVQCRWPYKILKQTNQPIPIVTFKFTLQLYFVEVPWPVIIITTLFCKPVIIICHNMGTHLTFFKNVYIDFSTFCKNSNQ